MKLAISYFYQIRFFERNMVPVSTAISDPIWYHQNGDPTTAFYDKRKVLNGLRLMPVCQVGKKVINENACHGARNECYLDNEGFCPFLKSYREKLNEIDFDAMMQSLERFTKNYQAAHKLQDEIIIVLIVYETPSNPCSERAPLIDYFRAHGIDCPELTFNKSK